MKITDQNRKSLLGRTATGKNYGGQVVTGEILSVNHAGFNGWMITVKTSNGTRSFPARGAQLI